MGIEGKKKGWQSEEELQAALAELEVLEKRGRRRFLKGAAAAVVLGTTPPTVKTVVEGFVGGEELKKEIEILRQGFHERYDIEVTFKLQDFFHKQNEADELFLQKKKEALEFLERELDHYPDFIIKSFSIPSISLVTSLEGKSSPISSNFIDEFLRKHQTGGKANTKSKEFTISYGGTLANLWNLFGWMNANQASKGLFHHELFHVMDTVSDEEWRKLNGNKGYARDERAVIKSDYIGKKVEGYARGYGMTDPLEDRATVVENLFTDSFDLEKRITSDKILEGKVNALKSFFAECSCGLMDGEYWELIKTITPTREYFHEKAEKMIRDENNSVKKEWKEKLEQLLRDGLL